MRLKMLMMITALIFAFAIGTGLGIYGRKNAEPSVAAPLMVEFCSLSANQDFLVGVPVKTKAEIILGIHGGVLASDSCNDNTLVFRGPENDTCWQQIVSDYDHRGANSDYFVEVEGSLRGRRKLVSWFGKGDAPTQNAVHHAPRTTFIIDRITNCTKKQD